MQSLQAQHNNNYDYVDCNYQSVDDFLHHCHLDQYSDVFLNEGFDSITSVYMDFFFLKKKKRCLFLIHSSISF